MMAEFSDLYTNKCKLGYRTSTYCSSCVGVHVGQCGSTCSPVLHQLPFWRVLWRLDRSPHGLSETNLLPLPTPFTIFLKIKAQTKFYFMRGLLAGEGLCSPEFVINWFESNCTN